MVYSLSLCYQSTTNKKVGTFLLLIEVLLSLQELRDITFQVYAILSRSLYSILSNTGKIQTGHTQSHQAKHRSNIHTFFYPSLVELLFCLLSKSDQGLANYGPWEVKSATAYFYK